LNYLQYLKTRIEFELEVALWWEFDFELEVETKFPKANSPYRFDLTYEAMKLCPLLKLPPKLITSKLAPYVERLEGISHVEVVGGYLNIFFDRVQFLANIS
jgi:arginyl-tRNA synthetase